MSERAKILVIEDEPEVRMLMLRMLIHSGCDAEGAPSGPEGLRLAERGQFDLITLDVDMPEMDGFEVCSRLKQIPQLQQTPVVFVTGRFAEEDMQRGRELGAADYITKPFSLQTLVSKLRAHTEKGKSPPIQTDKIAIAL